MSEYLEKNLAKHKGYAEAFEDDNLLLVIKSYRDQYGQSEDPYHDFFTVMRVYEDQAQSRGLKVPGGAYAPMSNPKRKVIQKSSKGRQLGRTMAARERKLQELERKAIEAIYPPTSNPVRAFSARGQVESTRSHRSRRGAMEEGRRSGVAKELKKKRTERALRAIGNPESREDYVSAGQILMSHDDGDPGLFEKSYAKWQVGNRSSDLLDAFESATRAEVNYRYGGREPESGFADAQAEGVRREILEIER